MLQYFTRHSCVQCSKPCFVKLTNSVEPNEMKAKLNLLIERLCTSETTSLQQVKAFHPACAALPALSFRLSK